MRRALTIACIAAVAVAGYDNEGMFFQHNVNSRLAQLEAGSLRPVPAELAQVGKAKQCLRTPNRAKKDQPDFWTIRNAGIEWTDPEFPPNIDAFYWKGAGEKN